jgi:hypothetical protein
VAPWRSQALKLRPGRCIVKYVNHQDGGGTYYCGQKKWDSFENFDVVQALLSFFDTILADSLKFYFILLFSFSKCPLLLIKVDFDSDFALNKYSLRASLQSFATTYNS